MGPDRQVIIKKSKIDLFFLLGVSYLFIMAFLILVPTKTITDNIEVSYPETETYYMQESYEEQEPFQALETYQVQESSTPSVPKYNIINAPSGSHFDTNSDKKTSDGCACSEWEYVATAHEHNNVVCVQKKCTISNSGENSRTVTKYRTVTTYRSVTKYQDVPKTRIVTKTRIEQQPVEVNWILGFKTPYTFRLPFIG
jgi:hypothetical protein